jgi:serine/threonine protein phosphatase PrpC
MPLVHVTAFTHVGRVRAGNEDAIVVGEWISDPEMTAPFTLSQRLADPLVCAVADGMGGHAAGEVASRYAARCLGGESYDGGAGAVAEALHAINAELYQAMAGEPSLAGMGTTVAGLVLWPTELVWFNVGDSRVYCCDGALTQVSIDDVPAQAFKTGVITQSLGGSLALKRVAPHVGREPLPVPSRWLICSDGLTDMLSDAEIARCLGEAPDAANDNLAGQGVEGGAPEAAALRLFDAAMAAGGVDNISLVIVGVAEG